MTAPNDVGPVQAIDKTTGATKAVAKPVGNKTGLNKVFHGVPVWGWLAMLVAAMVIVYVLKRNAATKAAQAKAASKTTDQGAGYTTSGYIAPTTVAASTSILTNSQWEQAAMNDLIQKGNDPVAATAAIQNYVANKPLTGDQQTMVNQAIKDIGPLPQMASGQNNNYSLLDTPKGGNLIGQLAYAGAGLLGLNNPDNAAAQYVDPFINDVINQGPISGVFQGANDLLGGSLGISGSTPSINIPGIGNISLNGSLSNSGLSVGGTAPDGSSGAVSLGPTGSNSYSTYIVNDGDTLQSISQQFYGGTGGAAIIYSANVNKIPDPNNLAAGTVLYIPATSNYSTTQ